MKTKELKVLNDRDLDSKILELRKELMKAYSQIATGTIPKSPGKVREMKKTIAKILTIKHEKTAESFAGNKKHNRGTNKE